MPKTAVSLVSSPFVPMVHAANGGQPLDQTDGQRGASWGYHKSLHNKERLGGSARFESTSEN